MRGSCRHAVAEPSSNRVGLGHPQRDRSRRVTAEPQPAGHEPGRQRGRAETAEELRQPVLVLFGGQASQVGNPPVHTRAGGRAGDHRGRGAAGGRRQSRERREQPAGDAERRALVGVVQLVQRGGQQLVDLAGVGVRARRQVVDPLLETDRPRCFAVVGLDQRPRLLALGRVELSPQQVRDGGV
jgi:hypothetical protein